MFTKENTLITYFNFVKYYKRENNIKALIFFFYLILIRIFDIS